MLRDYFSSINSGIAFVGIIGWFANDKVALFWRYEYISMVESLVFEISYYVIFLQNIVFKELLLTFLIWIFLKGTTIYILKLFKKHNMNIRILKINKNIIFQNEHYSGELFCIYDHRDIETTLAGLIRQRKQSSVTGSYLLKLIPLKNIYTLWITLCR